MEGEGGRRVRVGGREGGRKEGGRKEGRRDRGMEAGEGWKPGRDGSRE